MQKVCQKLQHYDDTPMYLYCDFHGIFRQKCDIFAPVLDCGYLLEPSY